MSLSVPGGVLIGGEWRRTGSTRPIASPFDGTVVAEVSDAGLDDVDAAVAAAESGFAATRRQPAHTRADVLRRVADMLAARAAEFVDTIVAEAGKPRRYAATEVQRAVQTLRFSAEEAKRLHGETVPMDAVQGSENRRGWFIRQPLGVIAAIGPFNFPLNLVCHKVGPALAAGNSVVLKPASATPLCALKLGELFLEAGLPAGALNVIPGRGSTVGMALVQNARVQMVTFTGSAAVGEEIHANSGLKRISLELGSNSGAIVDETCDLDVALGRCLVGGFAFSGQVCIHTQRLYLHESIADEFTDRFVSGAQRLTCGDPMLESTEIGPMIDRDALDRGLSLVAEARSSGAQILCGGEADGHVMLPTVVSSVEPDMKVVCEEAFAPVVTIETFADFDQAIDKFNRGSTAGIYAYGLAAGVFTHNVNRALRAAEGLQAGNVYINDSATFRADHQPYGGIRDSGVGREGPRFAIEEMTDIKMVSFNLDS
ncbi:MAG: aldehyde dehydrogenase family protein [candidate division WOR-3 bacterium]|nr:MAG: aldehyde dehydrogenase family protein [candidate division WOR-3 bacterium]